jgi:hypothetical protein
MAIFKHSSLRSATPNNLLLETAMKPRVAGVRWGMCVVISGLVVIEAVVTNV